MFTSHPHPYRADETVQVPGPAASQNAKRRARGVRFALIGAGGVGAYHRAAIERHQANGAATLVAVADPTSCGSDPEVAGLRRYSDYRELLDNEDLDAVTIATPIHLHFDMAIACLQRGVYTNLEKPPVPTLAQLTSLLAMENHARPRTSVGFQMISSRCVQKLKELIIEGRLGDILHINAGACWPRRDAYYTRASWAGQLALGGSPVFDGPATNGLAHLVHNIMFLAGETRRDFDTPVEVEGELYRARPIPSYDTACLRGKFAGGIRFALAVTHAAEQEMPFRIEVKGTRGWATLSHDGAVLDSSCGVRMEHPESTQELLYTSYDRFIEVLNGVRPRFDTRLKDAAGYVAATNGMLLSSQGIHDIDPAFSRRYDEGAPGQGGYDVTGLHHAIGQTISTGRLFSELALPWAIARPLRIDLTDLSLLETPLLAGKAVPEGVANQAFSANTLRHSEISR